MLGLSAKLLKGNYGEQLSPLDWTVDKPRKHWKLSRHCQNILYPKFLSNAPLLTDESKFYWHLYSSRIEYDRWFEKDIYRILKSSLIKASNHKNVLLTHILISEQLINLSKFDALSRKNFLRWTAYFIRKQSQLEVACLEGLKLNRDEAYQILSALTASNKCIKYLYLWRLLSQDDEFSIYDYCWLQPVLNLRYLQIISINYDYIATERGDVLILLARNLSRNWRCLQLLCLGEDISRKNLRNKMRIPDFAWNEVRKWSPYLKVHIILIGISNYDQHKTFLTQSIPLQSIFLSPNLKLISPEQCMIDCTFKCIYLWYHISLTQLYLNLYDVDDLFDYHLRNIFSRLPNLRIFEYTGKIEDPVTICNMCCQIKFGVCAVKKVILQIQKPKSIREYDDWLSKINCFLVYFKPDFQEMGVEFQIRRYPL